MIYSGSKDQVSIYLYKSTYMFDKIRIYIKFTTSLKGYLDKYGIITSNKSNEIKF